MEPPEGKAAGSVAVRDTDTGKILVRASGTLARAVLAPDDRSLLALELEPTGKEPAPVLRRWDLADGKELPAYRGLPPGSFPLCVSPDGRWLVCSWRQADRSAALRVLDLRALDAAAKAAAAGAGP